MTDRYVRKTGTDSGAGGTGAPWLTLTHAVANATGGDKIIVDDATVQTYDEATLVFSNQYIITAGAAVYCDGTEGSGIKLTNTGTGHVLNPTSSSETKTEFHGFEIVNDNSTTSGECCRAAAHLIFNDCIIRGADLVTGSQDGIYTLASQEIHIINCFMYNFSRACINTEGAAPNWYIQHSTLFNVGAGEATILDNSISACDYFIDNSIVANTTAAETFSGAGTITSVNNDNAHTEPSGAWGTEATDGVVAGTQASGSYICLTNITAGSEDLTLVAGGGNVAIDLAAVASSATNDPNDDSATSINGETRDYVAAHDAGAWEIAAVGGASIIPQAMHHSMMRNS